MILQLYSFITLVCGTQYRTLKILTKTLCQSTSSLFSLSFAMLFEYKAISSLNPDSGTFSYDIACKDATKLIKQEQSSK